MMQQNELDNQRLQREFINLKDLPDEKKTIEVCRMAVLQDGMNYLHVPNKFQSNSLLEIAVQRSPFLITNLPEKDFSEHICRKALLSQETKKTNSVELLYHIPYENVLKEGITMFSKMGNSMRDICNNLNTEVVKHICKDDLNNLKLLPKDYLNEENYFRLYKANPEFKEYIPNDIMKSPLFKTDMQMRKEGINWSADNVIKIMEGAKLLVNNNRGFTNMINLDKETGKLKISDFKLKCDLRKNLKKGFGLN